MKRILLTLALCLVVVGLMAAPALAAAPPEPSAGSFVNAGDVPPGSKLVLNITYKVTNDEDSGNVGYWALDSYNKSLQVWQVPDGTFYAVAKYTGKWQTFAGALSPGVGTAFTKDGQGTFEGGYVGTFDAASFTSAFGNIGTFDLGGTKADVILGTYGAGQTGITTPFNAISNYFPGYSNFIWVNWGWTYKYQNQRWNNFDYGTTGDIVF